MSTPIVRQFVSKDDSPRFLTERLMDDKISLILYLPCFSFIFSGSDQVGANGGRIGRLVAKSDRVVKETDWQSSHTHNGGFQWYTIHYRKQNTIANCRLFKSRMRSLYLTRINRSRVETNINFVHRLVMVTSRQVSRQPPID